jgi:hypothetical protein
MRSAVLAAAAALAAGCAAPATPGAAPSPLAVPTSAAPTRDPAQRYTVTGAVLESPDHGPQLCHVMADSLPPQCGGPDVVPWDWAEVAGEESRGGTTWGTYRLVGTFDGKTLRLTEKPAKPLPASPRPHQMEPSPCPEPAGGWRPSDPSKAGLRDREALISYAHKQPDFAGIWLSWPDGPPTTDLVDEGKHSVFNVTFTGDLDRHERAARKLWGGALCVAKAERTLDSLKRDQRALGDAQAEAVAAGVQILGSDASEQRNRLEVRTYIADEYARQWIAQRVQPGFTLEGWLTPV